MIAITTSSSIRVNPKRRAKTEAGRGALALTITLAHGRTPPHRAPPPRGSSRRARRSRIPHASRGRVGVQSARRQHLPEPLPPPHSIDLDDHPILDHHANTPHTEYPEPRTGVELRCLYPGPVAGRPLRPFRVGFSLFDMAFPIQRRVRVSSQVRHTPRRFPAIKPLKDRIIPWAFTPVKSIIAILDRFNEDHAPSRTTAARTAGGDPGGTVPFLSRVANLRFVSGPARAPRRPRSAARGRRRGPERPPEGPTPGSDRGARPGPSRPRRPKPIRRKHHV